jgi:preprotein translocase subunit SecD
MDKSMGWKVGLIVIVIAFSVVKFYPPGEKIVLGLDLKGGMHLVFQVQTEKAMQKHVDNNVHRLKTLLKESSITFTDVARRGADKIEASGVLFEDNRTLKDIFDDDFMEWDYRFSGDKAILIIKEKVKRELKNQTVQQALETISNRINAYGVADPVMQREGEDRLLIELPGVSDKEKTRVMGLIKSTAVLEFKKVENSGPFATEEEAVKQYGGTLPENLVVVKRDPKRVGKGFSILQSETVITGRDLKNAQRAQGEFPGIYKVSFSLKAQGAKQFQKFTSVNVGNNLAIVLDNRIIFDGVLRDVLTYGGDIIGQYTLEEADDLSLLLRSGSLPAELKPLHEQIIGPSLGADSIRKGIYAAVAGLLLVTVFMVFYYKMAGINSILAVILNIVILMGIMATIGFTLTLPGIAGIILTIGMAVDANVLVFERIKEDLKAGKSPKSAIDSGFKKAFVTIFDANLTTIIAAFFLLQFGTSAIKGFAVTLMIGIVASMFTAVFVSRVIFDLVYSGKKKLKKVSI